MRRVIGRAREDLSVIVARDPSIRTRAEALLHPALPALWTHRLAHALYIRGHRQLARFLAYLARAVTGGIEIHPGATLVEARVHRSRGRGGHRGDGRGR